MSDARMKRLPPKRSQREMELVGTVGDWEEVYVEKTWFPFGWTVIYKSSAMWYDWFPHRIPVPKFMAWWIAKLKLQKNANEGYETYIVDRPGWLEVWFGGDNGNH